MLAIPSAGLSKFLLKAKFSKEDVADFKNESSPCIPPRHFSEFEAKATNKKPSTLVVDAKLRRYSRDHTSDSGVDPNSDEPCLGSLREGIHNIE